MTLEYIVEICVAIDIAILSISYPIIVDKISNIGDKYSSQYISILFDNEFPQKVINYKIFKRVYQISIFKLTLYATILTFFFLIFKLKPLFGWDNWIINNSAKVTVLLATTILTIFFFVWLDKVVLYNGKSTSLLKRIITKYNGLKNDSEIKSYHLKSINELTFYAIQKQDEHLQETLLEFYYREFASIRQNHDKKKPLTYPIDLYLLVNKLNVELINNENKKLLALEHRAVSGTWLLGEDFENIIISEDTYTWLWRNLYLICDKEKYVKMYWAEVSQYFDYRLETINEQYDFNTASVINSIEVEKRKEERQNFLEFHYALGGLLIYRNQYKTIKYIFEYSQTIPPTYPLLPDNMTEIFYWLENFRNDFKSKKSPLDTKFYFPELDNLGNRKQINYWICSYLSLLFIRQFSLQSYYINQQFTALPRLPDDVIELNNWLDTVTYFEYCLQEIIKNKELFIALNWENLVATNEPKFNPFIADLIKAIKNKIGQQKLNAPLSAEKISKFKESTNIIITKSFEKYNDIFISLNENQKDKDLKVNITGITTLLTKSAFTDNDIPTLNYDTVIAEQAARINIERIIPNSFIISSTRRYLLNKENILLGLEKIIANSKEAIIIAINLDYEFNELLKASKYKSIIKNIPATDLRDVLFVLNKSDLPAIEHKTVKEEEIIDYKLDLLNDNLKIYASVIDINLEENKEIKNRWKLDKSSDSPDLKVQISIAFIAMIYWKKERDIIQINLASRYKEQGIQSEINEITSLKSDIDKASG